MFIPFVPLKQMPAPSPWEDPECPDIGRFPSDRPVEAGGLIRARDLGNPDDIRTVRIRLAEPTHGD